VMDPNQVRVEKERQSFIDAMHYILPEIRPDDSATSYRARCQVIIGESLWRAAMIKSIARYPENA